MPFRMSLSEQILPRVAKHMAKFVESDDKLSHMVQWQSPTVMNKKAYLCTTDKKLSQITGYFGILYLVVKHQSGGKETVV